MRVNGDPPFQRRHGAKFYQGGGQGAGEGHRHELPAIGAGSASARLTSPARMLIVDMVISSTCVRSGMRHLACCSRAYRGTYPPSSGREGAGKGLAGCNAWHHTVHGIEPAGGEEGHVGGIHKKRREEHLPAGSLIRAGTQQGFPRPNSCLGRGRA